MGSNPINLAVRFLLELTALFSIGIWGWHQADNWLRFLLAPSLPLIMAIIWGVFNVPNDPSHSGSAHVPVPGFIRLIIEFVFFALSTWAIFEISSTNFGLIFCIIIIAHYIFSYDRIKWLIQH